MADHQYGHKRFDPLASCLFDSDVAFMQLRSHPGQPPALEAVPSQYIDSISLASGFRNIVNLSSNNHSSNGAADSFKRRAVPPLDLSGLQSLIIMQPIQSSRKTSHGQIPWPPRIPCAPRSLAQPSPAGPTPVIGASRGSESERCTKSSHLDSGSGSTRRPKTRNSSSAEQDYAKPKLALVVAQGIEVQNSDAAPTMSSRSICAKDHVVSGNSVPAAPLAVSSSENAHHHHNHPRNLHPAAGANQKVTSLFTIEVRSMFLRMVVELYFLP